MLIGVQKLDAINSKEEEINDLADKEIERIKSWKDKETENYKAAKNILKV